MDRNGKRKGEQGMDAKLRRELQRAVCAEEKKDGRYGTGLHRKLKRDLSKLLAAAGLDESNMTVREMARMLYEVAEAVWCSREVWQKLEKKREYEMRAYIGKDGIRLFQTSTIEADSPPPQAPPILSILRHLNVKFIYVYMV
ncbi:MAG TPA: hypothetical protein VL945_02075 [Candidatus Saccharimonadales bacterium]|nr:hypothetical protein [Candidatus Saccharimonadales bacterium]